MRSLNNIAKLSCSDRKVQTFKDLTKPWAEIPSLSPHPVKPNKPLSSSSISSTPHNSPRPSSLSTLSLPSPPDLPTKCETVQAHSAMTTLLLDDSPRKAELQPYNHVCIPEYGGATRARDLVVLRLEKDREREEKLEDQVDASPVDSPMGEEGSSKKRKRKEKKRLKHAANHGPEQIYDETLIAVIGVLDEVKLQSNIAAWIRLGGLWGSPTKPSETPSRHLRDHSSPEGLNESGIPEEDGYVSGGSDLSVDGTRASVRKIRKKASPNDSSENKPPAGNDAVTSAVIPVVAKSSATDVELIGAKESPPAAMWFEDPVVMQYWVARGKKALERLGVALEHGIER